MIYMIRLGIFHVFLLTNSMKVKLCICVIICGPSSQQPVWHEMVRLNAGAANYTNQHSVSFRSKGIRVLLLCVLAHWRGSVT